MIQRKAALLKAGQSGDDGALTDGICVLANSRVHDAIYMARDRAWFLGYAAGESR